MRGVGSAGILAGGSAAFLLVIGVIAATIGGKPRRVRVIAKRVDPLGESIMRSPGATWCPVNRDSTEESIDV